jgi:hypothetical protein
MELYVSAFIVTCASIIGGILLMNETCKPSIR